MTRLCVTAALILLAISLAYAKNSPLACKTRPELVGACRVVHGRLMYYNGTPTFRIWIVGTKRLLGVYEIEVGDNPERPLMPERIWSLVWMMDHEVYADFEVCPLTEEEPHAMQMVCVESAQHVVKAPYRGARIRPAMSPPLNADTSH